MNLLQARLVGANRVASANYRVTHQVEGGSQPKGPGSPPVAAAQIKTYFAAYVHRNKAFTASPNLHPQETVQRRASRLDAGRLRPIALRSGVWRWEQMRRWAVVIGSSQHGVSNMNKIALVALASLALGACATPTQTVGTAGGVVAGAAVGGPVGAVVGGVVGAAVTAPGAPLGGYHHRCYWRDRYGYLHRRWC
jgi:hypothetical protein